MLAAVEVAPIGAVAEATAAALSQFEELEAALSQCVAGVTAIGVEPIAATAAIAATVSVRPRWAPLRSEPLRPGPIAAAATTPTATTFAPAGTVRTERRTPCASEVAAWIRQLGHTKLIAAAVSCDRQCRYRARVTFRLA